jgi:hypothetical protein
MGKLRNRFEDDYRERMAKVHANVRAIRGVGMPEQTPKKESRIRKFMRFLK